MQQILEVDITKVFPDPKQPRQYFDKEELQEMANNIKEVGVINPIETDGLGKIITGERRYRAAKMAGLTKVPTRILSGLDERQIFFRQVSENIHHNTMSPWETAKALDRLLNDKFIGKKKLHATTHDKGIARLAGKLGQNPVNIRRMLKLLEERPDVQEALKKNKISHTLVFEVRSAPPEFQNELRDRMLKGEFDKASKWGVRMLSRALRTQPKDAKRILAGNYAGMDGNAMKGEILRRAPTYTDTPISEQLRENLKGYQQLLNACNHLGKVLDANPPANIPKLRQKQAVLQVAMMMGTMRKWVELLPSDFKEGIKKLKTSKK